MKKLLSILVALAVVFAMAGCSSNKSDDSSKKDASKSKQITLTYANWNLGTAKDNNVERQMIKEFEKQNPNIKIKIDESIDPQKWNESLSTAASAGKLPDVFMLLSAPEGVANGWLMNLNDLTKNDADFAKVSQSVTGAVTYKNNLYALPFGQHFLGYFVNKDLFNKANLDYPEYGVSLDDFVNDVKKITNVQNGVVGLSEYVSIPDWYPVAANSNMGYFTYNNGKYQLDSKEFIDGINLAKTLVTNGYSFNDLTDAQKANFKGGKDGAKVWEQGGIALKWDGTWAVDGYKKTLGFDWDFVGIPGNRTVVTDDYVGISSATKNPEAAYKFAKWMSFGKKGYLKRMELADKAGTAVSSLPIMNDKDLLDKYFAINNIPGIRKAYENLDKAVVEPPKVVPGYIDSRWNALTGVKVGDNANANVSQLIDAFVKGQLKVEDYAKQLNQLANKNYQDAAAKVEAKVK